MSAEAISSQSVLSRTSRRAGSPFSRASVFAILLIGFLAFMAMLYFLGVGDTGGESSNRNAHASSNGLHGFAGLAQLLEANGYEVEKSRELSGLETLDLLILTPSLWTDADEFAEILENRQYYGPTLVILPKWMVFRPAGEIADVDADRVQDDWVQLGSPTFPSWIEGLPEPYAMRLQLERTEQGVAARWAGLSLSGELPTADSVYAEQTSGQQALVIDPGGRRLAVNVIGEEGSFFYEEAHFVTFVVEPDLMNNYGLANPERAALALALIEQAGYEERSVTFDMTLVGLGESTNLLTLAFRPPFLAATLCLILAMVIVGWRAFLRFGPVADKADEARFGKAQLVRNGAGLIVRAGRLSLLADPYIALTQRKLGRALGLTSPDPDAIDAALRQRLPDEEPYSIRVTRLQNAARAGELVRAAQSLNDLTAKTLGNSRR